MTEPFHLSIGVKNIDESVRFFEDVLMAKTVHRDPSGYVNIDFYGNQITLKHIPGIDPKMQELHFGVNLSLQQFDQVSTHIAGTNYAGIVAPAKTVDAGTKMERRKIYVRCSTGYLFEIKGYPRAN